MKVLITGAAGFIAYHTSKRLLEEGHEVVGYDIVDDYYDVNLKNDRLKILDAYENFRFYKNDLEDKAAVEKVFADEKPDRVINLAAQAGVRFSIENPDKFFQSNVIGFLNILEACKNHKTEHLVYASTSSVYGLNTNYPFKVSDNVDHPVSTYAVTKKTNELMAHTYSHLFGLPTTGLRFFTVYGPWGRPDMALFLFTKAILDGSPLDVYNFGDMERDFTYVDDIVEGMVRVLMKIPQANPQWTGDNPDPSSSSAPYRIYNIGSNRSVKLMDFIQEIEKNLGLKAKLNMMPMQPGDVPRSHADVSDLFEGLDYKPKYDVEHGIREFVKWYIDYYKIQPTSSKS